MRIKLNDKTRKIWTEFSTDLVSFLDIILGFIEETLTPQGKAKQELFKNARFKISHYFQLDNWSKGATMGAYFRSLTYKNLVIITDEDEKCLSEILAGTSAEEDWKTILPSFAGSRSPSEGHRNFLKSIFFTEEEKIHLRNCKEKYKDWVDTLLDATFNIIDFMCTPLTVLMAEEDVAVMMAEYKAQKIQRLGDEPPKEMPQSEISSPTLQWQSMMNALQQALTNIVGEKKESSALQKIQGDISLHTIKLKSCFKTAVTHYDNEIANRKLGDKLVTTLERARDDLNERLTRSKVKSRQLKEELHSSKSDYRKVADYVRTLSAEPIGDAPDALIRVIRKYGEDWQRCYDALVTEENTRPQSESLQEESTQQPPITPAPLIFNELLKTFQEKFKGTNSSGIKAMITAMSILRGETSCEIDKLALLSKAMKKIAKERKDSRWSKSHFFGNGRHSDVQELYNLLAEPNFSLNVDSFRERFLDFLGDPSRHFTHAH